VAQLTHNPTATAIAIVQGKRHELGIWADLTPAQLDGIQAVIDADQAGTVTRTDIVARLDQVAQDGTA
jgi:hypothetical protein